MTAYYRLVANDWMASDARMDERAFCYGDGFFSTLGVYDAKILHLEGHHWRITTGMTAFALQLDVPLLIQHLSKLAQQIGEGIIKIIITRNPQAIRGYGYAPKASGEQACVFVKAMPSALYQATNFIQGIPMASGIEMTTLDSTISHRSARLAGLKLIACPEQVFAHSELLVRQATKPQLADGLVANVHGDWVCATMGNIFYRLEGAWHTPPVDKSGVLGVMRQALMSVADVSERVLACDELSRIDALCTTNAVRGIVPVSTLWQGDTEYQLSGDLPIR